MTKQTTLKTLLAAPLLALTIVMAMPAATIAQNKPQEQKPFMYAEQMPVYKGGEKELLNFLTNNINYPADARAAGLEGLVVVTFVVDETGKVNDAKVAKKLGRGTDEEALRVINLTNGNWTPGRQDGKAVAVQYTMPVRFSLNESERAATASIANQSPKFKGGQEAFFNTISKHLQLPAEAKKENLNARVVVRFYVDKDGAVSNIRLEETKLKKTVGAGANMDYMDASTFQLQNKAVLAKLTEAATAAVRATSGKWEPALKNGLPAGSELALPLHFTGSNTTNPTTLGTPEMTKYTKAGYSFEEVDVKPVFKEGSLERFLAKNLRYPADINFEGTVKTGFFINEDGKIIGPLMFVDTDFGKEGYAIQQEIKRVFNLMEGKWEPGKVDGKAVSVTKVIIIQFVTDKSSKKTTDTAATKPDVIVTRFK
ncbi:TonB family protein [Pontibacter burrus]|uniref:TonB family protein n=1 Tax=Pontibacter burrus TaxID=2704466 RepID=A0A6B3LW97_9BACT|nr:TonB family protein [Pontibacter burrus]NEM98576.1 TonB family protein [Pontibacter burrus]